MRRLRVVGLGDDDETVILEDPIRHERFTVPGDERLRAAARGDVRRLGQMEIDAVTPLRPRDIQARIRAGESVEQVAAHGGVTHAHVERFAYPVLLERARVADLAGRARPRQEGVEPADARTLREVVTSTLATRGQDHDDPRWDAWKAEDGAWVVGLAWRAGRTDNLAHWTYRPGPSGGAITARDDPARELLGEAPVGGPRRVGESRPEEQAATAPTTTTGAATEAVPEAVEVDTEIEDEVEVEDELPTATTASGEVAPRPGRRGEGGGSASPGSTSPGSTTAGSGARRSTTREPRRPRAGRSDVPDQRHRPAPPAPPPNAGAAADTDARGRPRRHPIVPSWEDVLLGVRSPRE